MKPEYGGGEFWRGALLWFALLESSAFAAGVLVGWYVWGR
jgi:hypothetical protein